MKRMLTPFIATVLCALALSQTTAVHARFNSIDDTDFFVQQLYWDVLERAPDLSGFVAWRNYINACGSDTNCIFQRRITTARGFFESPEFFNNHPNISQHTAGSTPYNQEYVRELYRHFLQREPEGHPDMFDNPWFVYITTNPGEYDTLVNGFISSTEYRNRFE